MYMQGGPGCAGNFGNFYELGPFLVNDSLALVANAGAWNQKHGLLFIDQPIGTGFSRAGITQVHACSRAQLHMHQSCHGCMRSVHRSCTCNSLY